MSHFSVYVFHDEDTSVDDLLAPYDENLEVDEPQIRFTKDEAIKECRKEIEFYKNNTYAEYLKNQEEYEEKYSNNVEHLNYLKNEFPKRLTWTDDECYEHYKNRYGGTTDPNGNILVNYNTDGKWDWYEIGGRWSGDIPNDEIAICKIKIDKINTPYAFITPYGEWFERGEIGWFGCASNEKNEDDWDNEFKNYLKDLIKKNKKFILTQVDCHI